MVPIVVCSRISDYEALTPRLRLRGAVVVQPLTLEQIDSYLTSVGTGLEGVRDAIHRDAVLRELAQTPLMLSIMTLAYRDRAVPVLDSFEHWHTHLFTAYIDQMFQRRRPPAHYSRECTLGWLIWLARTLDQRSQAIFFIERMQPQRLLAYAQQRQYAIGVGLILGLIFGLVAGISAGLIGGLAAGEIFGLPRWEVFGLIAGVANGLVASVIAGLLFGLAVNQKESHAVSDPRRQFSVRHTVYRGSVIGLFIGIAGGLVAGLASKLMNGSVNDLVVWLSAGLYSGLFNGFVSGLTVGLVTNPSKIEIVETLRWSWAKARTVSKIGLAFGVGGGVVVGLCQELASRLIFGRSHALVAGLSSGIAFGLATLVTLLVTTGLTVGEIETKTAPNQGIWRSARNVLNVGGAVCLMVGVQAGVVYWLVQRLLGEMYGLSVDLAFALLYGLPVGLAVGLLYGGLACIQHIVLRYILYRAGAIPWRYARFLDEAAEHIFLRKVGGGYIFVHRLLQEYFVALDPDHPVVSTPE
jgi:hypothetical protein